VLYAPLDIVLTDFDVVQPDLIVFSAERAHLIHPKVVPRHPPDLAIEILSPTTAATDRGRKKALLAKHLVREYWLVDPVAQRLEVHRLGADGFALAIAAERHDVVTPIVLPQLSFRPSDVIPDVP
jgi:Uma2 family endonuclease